MTRDAVTEGAEEELLEATSAWLAVAVVRQRRAGLDAIRAKRRPSIFFFWYFKTFVERKRDCLISNSCFVVKKKGVEMNAQKQKQIGRVIPGNNYVRYKL